MNILNNIYENFIIMHREKHEINKYKDKNRKKIYSKINLTKDQKKSIDNLYKNNYGKSIPYTWHRHFTAFTGNFDKFYFPELLYIPDFEYFMNIDKEYCRVYEDKNFLPILAKTVNIKTPDFYICCISGIYYNNQYNEITKKEAFEIIYNIGSCFIKPTIDSNSGQGCKIININMGIDIESKELIENIINNIGNNFVIQKIIKCHDSISKLYSKSVNTFRVITYRWKDEIKCMPAIMRIGQGGNFLDNAHAGGMFIAIDNNGTLHKTAFTEFNKQYNCHPNSNIIFDGYKINLFPKVIESAVKMHKIMPQVGVVNWDFTIDTKGNPILVEANIVGGSIWLIQMAHGKGVFEEQTPEVLNWIGFMKKLNYKERKKYKFGYLK